MDLGKELMLFFFPKGYVECDGKFVVDDYIFYTTEEPSPVTPLTDDRYVLFLSGLKMGSSPENLFKLELLKNWIFGNFGSNSTVEAAKLIRIIIAGNSTNNSTAIVKRAYNAPSNSAELLESVGAFDTFVADLCRSVPAVDLMPGEFDLTNFMMPQQPLHPCMLPQARVMSNFTCATNPYEAEVEGRHILGCAGQNLKDIKKNCKLGDSLAALKHSLLWAHMAPTCPDTLPGYPYNGDDPFVIRRAPHVYFAGNCDKFSTETMNQTRLVCVPEFSTSGSAVLLNLKNFECKLIRLGQEIDDE